MKRIFALLLFILPGVIFAADQEFVQGTDYEVVQQNPGIPTTAANKIEVTEFFSFGCPWCFKLEPALQAWRKQQPTELVLTRVPVIFEKNWDLYAKAYYLAESLNMADKLSAAIFDELQVQNRNLSSNSLMIKFLVAHGVDQNTATSAFESSPSLDAKVQQGQQLMQAYQVIMIPSFVVNGKYKTNLKLAAGDNKRLFEIVDFLIKKVKKEGAA